MNPAPRTKIEHVLVGLVAAMVALAGVRFTEVVASPTLDESWEAGLSYALIHRFHAGTDYVFTFGPLGAFYANTYFAPLFWWAYGLAILFAAALVIVVIRLTRNQSFPYTIAVLGLLFFILPLGLNEIIFFPLLVCLGITLAGEKISWVEESISIGFLVLIALIKFTFFLYFLCIVAVSTLLLLNQRRNVEAFRRLVWGALIFFSLWFGLGQHFADLGSYLRGSWEIANGYSEAMIIWGRYFILSKGIWVLAGFAGLLFSPVLKGNAQTRGRALLCGLVVFLAWKEGFVRQDIHATFFFGFAAILSVLVPSFLPAGRESRWQPLLVLVSLSISLVGLHQSWKSEIGIPHFFTRATRAMSINAERLLLPVRRKAYLERDQAKKEFQFALPETKKRVGNAPMDVISYEQGVIFLNHMVWDPRPTFQSYSSYTPFLQARNAAFYRSAKAPEYVLLKIQPIDGRFPTVEEGPVVLELLARYFPISEERGYLLLRKKPPSQIVYQKSGPPHVIKTVRWGEAFKIPIRQPREWQWASIQIHYTWVGRILKFFLKSSEVLLKVILADGRNLTYRILPSVADSGFLLNPLLESTDDLLKLYQGDFGKSILSVSLSAGKGRACFFNKEITLDITTLR